MLQGTFFVPDQIKTLRIGRNRVRISTNVYTIKQKSGKNWKIKGFCEERVEYI